MTDGEASSLNDLSHETVVIGRMSYELRQETRPSDCESVRGIVESTGFFHPYEVDIAVELVDERLRRGDASGYHFLFLELDGVPIAYACYGPIACTLDSYDVFWIAVRKSSQGDGLGRWLMKRTEDCIRAQGGGRIYVETSGRPDYLPTRNFYLRCHYQLVAELPDFYAPEDPKFIFLKVLKNSQSTASEVG